jgi:hypothetical protein
MPNLLPAVAARRAALEGSRLRIALTAAPAARSG